MRDNSLRVSVSSFISRAERWLRMPEITAGMMVAAHRLMSMTSPTRISATGLPPRLIRSIVAVIARLMPVEMAMRRIVCRTTSLSVVI